MSSKKIINKVWSFIDPAKKNYKFATKACANYPPRSPVATVNTPIFATSTYKIASTEHGAALSEKKEIPGMSPYFYSRWGNPTVEVVATQITQLEKGFATHLCGSGMAAIITSILAFVKQGDHIVAPREVYGGTYAFFQKVLPKYGIEVTLIDDRSAAGYQSAIKKNTKILYVETPANPTMTIVDLAEVSKVAKDHNLVSMIDSTFASPYNQNPIDYGFDIVLHSCTKYLGGHSDLLAGSITSRNLELHDTIYDTLKTFGGILGPFDAFLLGRGIKTLDVRMERHNKNGMEIAKFLDQHPKVEGVLYPGLPSHPQHEIAKKQMRGFGGMISFDVKGGIEAGRTLLENVKIISLAVSLGGVESLIEQAATMTHTMVKREDRLKAGIGDGQVRLSVGLEDPEDLMKDLDQALSKV